MSSDQRRHQTPFRIPSAQSAPARAAGWMSSSAANSPAGRPGFSSPLPRLPAQGVLTPTGGRVSGSSRRASSRAESQPYPSSPPLPSYTRRQRLSLRPPSQRIPSSTSSPQPHDADHDLADESLSQGDADALNEIIMAIDMKDNGAHGSTLGCAYYVAMQETLYLLEDVAMASIDLAETLLLHANPTTVLISTRAAETLADCLARGAQGIDGNKGDLRGAYILRNLNAVDFRYEGGKDKLLSLDLGMSGRQSILYASVVDGGLPDVDDYARDGGSRQGRLMRLGTSINLESHLTVGCAGAVLSDLQRRKSAQYLPDDPDALVAFRIRSVEMFSLFDCMFVNADTLVSLQILQSEWHPNSHQQGPSGSTSGAKESLSVYGLFQPFASTPQGKMNLRQIFLRPSIDLDLINERQKTLSFLLRPAIADVLAALSKDLRKIKNMKSAIALLRKGVDSPGRKISVANNVWAALQRFTAYSLRLREALKGIPSAEKMSIIQKVCEAIDMQQLYQVGELITQTIDFEQSMERGRTAVKQGVDSDLDELKRSYDGMGHFLTTVIAKLRGELPEWARKYVENCIFFPQLGFLTVVSLNPTTGKGNYDGEGLDDLWERMFTAEDNVYYKNRQMKEMDEQFGDAYCMIIDREIEILHELTVSVLGREDAIIAASEVLGELDSLLALAIGCGQYKWVAPKMTSDNVMHIRGGRHPLQELVVSSFVANDCHIAGAPATEGEEPAGSSAMMRDVEEHPSTLILTGPNHSGKSVYLKQIAIIVYLAHIGCFVPAEQACIGITDRILTRVATRESVARNESAFAIDLRQVAFALNFATRRSLVLIDEFGKGTASEDGAGLMTATLDHFTNLGPERPKVLAATHFHEIFEGGFLDECPHIAFAHMDIRLDFEAPTTEDQVTYLYQLVPGRSICSFGSRCAAINGVDRAVVDRAETIILQMAQNEDLEVVCSKLSDAEARDLEQAEAVARAFLEENFTAPSAPNGANRSLEPNGYRIKLERVLHGESTLDASSTT